MRLKKMFSSVLKKEPPCGSVMKVESSKSGQKQTLKVTPKATQKHPFYPELSCQNVIIADNTGFKRTLNQLFGAKRSQVQILSPRPKTGCECPFMSGFFLRFAQIRWIILDIGQFRIHPDSNGFCRICVHFVCFSV